MSQLRSDIWCSAFLRRRNDLGQICVVSRRGDPIAGQIWIEVDHLDGTISLYAPASSLHYGANDSDRLFEARLQRAEPTKVRERIMREAEFDPDFWLLSLETREDAVGFDLVKPKT